MAASEKTLIGPETRIAGEIRGDEDIVVQGRIDGRLAIGGTLSVEDGAILQADVEARTVVVSGVIVGNVAASEIIRLTSKARVVGDVTAPRVVIEAGAAYKGRLEMGEVTLSAAEGEARATSRRTSDRENGASTHRAPPRVAPPARVGATPGAVITRSTTTTSPPRAAAAPARTPPSLPRPEAAAAGGVASSPGWAKKKLHRRG